MGAKERLAKLEERLDRQEVNRLLALPFEEVVEWLADRRSERVHSLYFRSLSTEALIELARKVFRVITAYDLDLGEEEVSEEQVGAWCRENLPEPEEGPRRMEPNFNCD